MCFERNHIDSQWLCFMFEIAVYPSQSISNLTRHVDNIQTHKLHAITRIHGLCCFQQWGAMAATFPYRGVPAGMPPGVPPPAPVPDYMSEEKLQEKGLYHSWRKVTFLCCCGQKQTWSLFSYVQCSPCSQQENGSSCRQSATQRRESLALLMLRRKTCHLSMCARSSGTMETWPTESFAMTKGSTSGKKWIIHKVIHELTKNIK